MLGFGDGTAKIEFWVGFNSEKLFINLLIFEGSLSLEPDAPDAYKFSIVSDFLKVVP